MTSESGFESMPRLDTIKVPIANIRAKPTTESPVIAKLKMGTDVTLLHQDDAWYAVKLLDGQLGWAHQSLFVESE
jgi:SH3-like domain-containing protein